jgi:SpoVK/Ycf46/Vps4 family AAA+-type ATPase
MPVDPSVIKALESALAAASDNDALRLHLAELLVHAGRPGDALAHAVRIIGSNPGNVAALRVGADAAERLGQIEQARTYRQIADAMSGAGERSVANSAPDRAGRTTPDGQEDVPNTADELLQRWDDSVPPSEPEIGTMSRPSITLADVAGMADVKGRLDLSLLAPLRHPELTSQFGKSLRGGLLLWGPPGCGKTYVARALAGELGASFYEVGLSDILDMWIGSSERNLASVFEWARRNRPCLLFFDEIDALGRSRSQLRGGGAAMRGVVNQFLAELDGASTDNEGVFVLAATNHPWDVDSALMRPGRFDRSVLVLPPDLDARRTIFELKLASRPTSGLDLNKLAKATEGRSGADLALICEHATERAMGATISDGVLRPISQADLLDGIETTRSSVTGWMETARNYVQFSNQSGNYDEFAAYFNKRKR